jgi:hypothetical protein
LQEFEDGAIAFVVEVPRCDLLALTCRRGILALGLRQLFGGKARDRPQSVRALQIKKNNLEMPEKKMLRPDP